MHKYPNLASIDLMDKATEIRRRINYVADLIHKSEAVLTAEPKRDYNEFYRHFQEVVKYLDRNVETISNQIPKLIEPNIFNQRLGGLSTITMVGLLNPFFAILLLTITFPISVPYLIIRAIILTRTKRRVEDAMICLTQVVNRWKEQRMEMTSRE